MERRIIILIKTAAGSGGPSFIWSGSSQLLNEKPRSRCCVGRRPGQWARYGGRPDDTMVGDSVTERLTRCAECARFSWRKQEGTNYKKQNPTEKCESALPSDGKPPSPTITLRRKPIFRHLRLAFGPQGPH